MYKIAFIPFLLGVVFSLNSSGQGSFNTVEELANKLIKTIRKQDTTQLPILHTNDSILIQNFSESLGFNFSNAVESRILDIINEGNEKGIDWSKIKFVKVEYITERDGPFEIAQPAVIIFQHRLFRYSISLNCSKINNSWGFVPIQRSDEMIKMNNY